MDSKLIAIVDDFVKRFFAGDCLIATPPVDSRVVGRLRNMGLIQMNLANALNLYVTAKSDVSARLCLRWITKARSRGMIVESESSFSKSNRFEQENIQLKEENTELKKEILRLKQLNEDLHRIVDNFGAKRPGKGVSGEQQP